MSDVLDLSAAQPRESHSLAILFPGTKKPTGWTIELAGPAHPQTVALMDEASREFIERQDAIEFAQVNGRKWKGDQTSAEDRRRRNVSMVCRRIIGWSPNPVFRFVSPEPIAFSVEAATNLFLRPDMAGFFSQVTDYLNSEAAFTQPSGQT